MDINFSFKNLCRVCLEEGANLSLYDDEEDMKLCLKVMACSSVEVCENDGFPRNICPLCYNMLNTAFEFKQRCETSDYKLRNSYVKDIVKAETDFSYPGEDLFAGDYSDEDNKPFKTSDDIKLYDADDIKEEEVVSRKKTISKKKKKWKAEEKKKISEKRVTRQEKKKLSSQSQPSTKRKCVSNRIATSLLEGTCIWNGRDWRFGEVDKEDAEKVKKELEELPKLIKAKEDMLEAKKNKRKSRVKKEKSLTVNLCDTCGKTFKSKYHLKYHIMLKHQEITVSSIKCKDPDCKKMFKLDHYMQRHLKRCHSARREFVCNECGKQYAFISGLKQHMKTHSGTQVWKHCNFCSQKYRTQKSVDIHIRSVHTGERPSVCTMCDSAFFHDDYLKEHMRLHTGETPYKCPICKRGYAQRGNMKSHMKQHRMSELDDTMKATMKPNYLKLLRDC